MNWIKQKKLQKKLNQLNKLSPFCSSTQQIPKPNLNFFFFNQIETNLIEFVLGLT